MKGEHSIIVGKVTAFNDTQKTIDVEPVNGDAPVQDVRLTPIEGQGNILFVPEVNSYVVIGFLESQQTNAYAIGFSSLEKVEITASEIAYNGGNKGGLVIVGDLVSKLNQIENKINSLIQEYQTHTHPAPGGVTGPTISTLTPLTPTQTNDIENPDISQ